MAKSWRRLVNSAATEEQIKAFRAHERTDRALGDEEFRKRLEKKLGRVLRRQRPGPRKTGSSHLRMASRELRPGIGPFLSGESENYLPVVGDEMHGVGEGKGFFPPADSTDLGSFPRLNARTKAWFNSTAGIGIEFPVIPGGHQEFHEGLLLPNGFKSRFRFSNLFFQRGEVSADITAASIRRTKRISNNPAYQLLTGASIGRPQLPQASVMGQLGQEAWIFGNGKGSIHTRKRWFRLLPSGRSWAVETERDSHGGRLRVNPVPTHFQRAILAG